MRSGASSLLAQGAAGYGVMRAPWNDAAFDLSPLVDELRGSSSRSLLAL